MQVAPDVENAAAIALPAVLYRVRLALERSCRRADGVRVVAVGKTSLSLSSARYTMMDTTVSAKNMFKRLSKRVLRCLLHEDIEWHFAGHLQSNKVKSLLSMML
nr:proline synthase co-transcribed bacterial homolog protein-like [Ipomoea batatas]